MSRPPPMTVGQLRQALAHAEGHIPDDTPILVMVGGQPATISEFRWDAPEMEELRSWSDPDWRGAVQIGVSRATITAITG